MANLQDIINIVKTDGGKFFVMDEKGEINLVVLGIGDYENLLLGKIKKPTEDIEAVNQLITKAQLVEKDEPVSAVTPVKLSGEPAINRVHFQSPDLRAEVIDPSFDFDGPKIAVDDL